MPKKRVNNIEIYYEIHGEGFPIVMIHGFTANLDWWPKTLKTSSQKLLR